MDDRSLYQAILGLSKPWFVKGVELRLQEGEVRIAVEVDAEVGLACPECNRDAPRYDQSEERQWRHLDTCQYRTIVMGAGAPSPLCRTRGPADPGAVVGRSQPIYGAV